MTIAGRLRWRRLRARRETGAADAAADRVAADRDAAFVALFEGLFDDVYRYCRLRLDDPADAEDAAALVFANAYAAYPPARPEATRSWLFAIAHNVVANHHRARQARGSSRSLDDVFDLPDPAASPEALACAADEGRALREALARLPDDQRRVVELRLAGLTGPEIAAALGRSHAAAKMLQLRAIDRLRAILAPPGDRAGRTDREEAADVRRPG